MFSKFCSLNTVSVTFTLTGHNDRHKRHVSACYKMSLCGDNVPEPCQRHDILITPHKAIAAVWGGERGWHESMQIII